MTLRKLKQLFLGLSSLALAGLLTPAGAAPVKTDFVFIIDATSSMAGEIAGVRNGFSAFVGGLNAATVDARFSIIIFGGAPELVLDFTSDATATQTALNSITIGANAGFQNNHNVNPEAGLEAIRIALGAASTNTLVRDNVGGAGGLSFRSDARKNLILVTDEDSDSPYYAANRFAGESGFGGSNGYSTPDAPSPLTQGWQDEVNATAQAVIQNQAFLNMLINVGDVPSRSQYGDYTKDVADADLSNFDPAATLVALLADALTASSLQAQVLQSGLLARAFNVSGANDSDFVDNFFLAKLQEVLDDPGVPNGVPEPATLALLGLALAGLGWTRRRRLS